MLCGPLVVGSGQNGTLQCPTIQGAFGVGRDVLHRL